MNAVEAVCIVMCLFLNEFSDFTFFFIYIYSYVYSYILHRVYIYSLYTCILLMFIFNNWEISVYFTDFQADIMP